MNTNHFVFISQIVVRGLQLRVIYKLVVPTFLAVDSE